MKARPRSAKRRRSVRAGRLQFESLEDRRLLAGDVAWVDQFGLDNAPGGTSATVASADGNLYILGRTGGVLPGEAGGGDFLQKRDAAGNELWTRPLDLDDNNVFPEFAYSIAVSGTGIYVAGVIDWAPPTWDGQEDPDIDAFVLKFDLDGNQQWMRQFGSVGVEAHDFALAVTADATDVYVTGYTHQPLPGQANAGGYIRKYDAFGNEVWTQQFGGEIPSEITVDATGVYVAGYTSAGGYDGIARKYDLGGGELWARQFGTSADDLPLGIVVSAGDVYVAGVTSGEFAGQSNAGNQDAFVWKFDQVASEMVAQFGSSENDYYNGIDADATGVYLSGFTEGALPGQLSSGANDPFVRKLDFGLNEIWTRQFGTSDDEVESSLGGARRGVSVDASGIYVTGVTAGEFGGQVGSGDVYLRQYDLVGDELWTRKFGYFIPANVFPSASAADAEGNVYVVGVTNGTFPGQSNASGAFTFVRKYDPSGIAVWTRQFALANGNTLRIAVGASGVYVSDTDFGSGDAVVKKLDSNGNDVWTREFGTSGFEQASDIAVDGTGIYVSGTTTDAFPGQTSAGNGDVFVRKYDADGNEVWTSQFGTLFVDEAPRIAVNESGIYVGGSTSGAFPGQTYAGGGDVFVRKLSSDGSEVWTRQFGTEHRDNPRGIALDATGIYVGGYTEGGAFPGQTNAGVTDSFIWKYDPEGNDSWVRQFGTSDADYATGIAADVTGVYITGYTSGALPGQTNAGDVDFFVKKYGAVGDEVWTRQIGTSGGDSSVGISAGPAGVFVSGATGGAFLGHTKIGPADGFVIKFAEESNTIVVPVDTATIAEDLQSVVSNIQMATPGPGAETPEIVLAVDSTVLSAVIAAVEALAPSTGDSVVTIVVTLADGDYQGQNIDVPAGVRLIIDGTNSSVTFEGASPALTVNSGVVVITGVTFVNATDAATILVTGGSLVLRDSIVQETIGGSRAAIEITGGSVDLGTLADAGGNTINVNGPGELVRNTGGQFVAALGNTFAVDGAALGSASLVEARVHHGLDALGLGIVGFANSGLFVNASTATVTGQAGALVENTGTFGAFGANTVALSASVGSVALTGDGKWKWSYQTTAGVGQNHSVEIKATASNGTTTSTTFALAVTAASTPGVTLTGGVLTILGSDGGDVVVISRLLNQIIIASSASSAIKTFAASEVTAIRVDVRGGNDIVATTANVTKPMTIEGGSGNDVLTGGGGANTILGGAGNDLLYGADGADILLGGDGDDLLFGGAGRDILIGGDGADTLLGNADDDILVAGTTAFDAHAAALAAIMAEWTSGRSYAQRTANIGGSGTGASFASRLNGNFFLNVNAAQGSVTVHDDNDKDTLSGDAGRDWFFANLNLDGDDAAARKDVISDLSSNEIAHDLDYLIAV